MVFPIRRVREANFSLLSSTFPVAHFASSTECHRKVNTSWKYKGKDGKIWVEMAEDADVALILKRWYFTNPNSNGK